jgi:hypothetical protein
MRDNLGLEVWLLLYDFADGKPLCAFDHKVRFHLRPSLNSDDLCDCAVGEQIGFRRIARFRFGLIEGMSGILLRTTEQLLSVL